MKLNKLPLFDELLKVFDAYDIQSWQISDFVLHINLICGQVSGNDYHKLYRLILRLVKEGYLVIDSEKNKNSPRTFSETEKLKYIRNTGCEEIDSAINELSLKKKEFQVQFEELMGEVKALEVLKESCPSLELKIEHVKCSKVREAIQLSAKIKAIESVVSYIS